MTLIIAFIVAHLGVIATAGGALAAIVAAWLHGKSTGTTKAQDEAKAAIGAAQSQAQTAQQQAAQSAADAEQAQKSLQDVQTAAQAQADAAKIPDNQLDAQLAQLGALRKD
jgi:flagellar biosynthesis component FlhA